LKPRPWKFTQHAFAAAKKCLENRNVWLAIHRILPQPADQTAEIIIGLPMPLRTRRQALTVALLHFTAPGAGKWKSGCSRR
jgi:hypothetical protein